MPDPDAAATAAIDAMGQWYWDSIPHDVLQAGIDAARPVIEAEATARERQRIRQLAIDTYAVCTADEGTQHFFADLLDGDGDAR